MIDKLTSELDDAVRVFMDAIPGIEKEIYNSLLSELKGITTYADGSIKNNLENIKRIGRIKKTLEKIILNKKYLKNVSGFAESFTTVEKIQNLYFSKLNVDFTPTKVLAEIKKQAVNDTVELLTENGINTNIVDPIKQIIKTNITSGGSYAELTEQLRNKILGTKDVDGTLLKYSRQITTDSINQYSATYTQKITADLGLKWFRYTGSLLKTSRPFCKELVHKSYVFKDEFPDLIKGEVGDKKVPLGKDGLPNGMNENTTPENFPILRGGYNCGHQLIPISEVSVPQSMRTKTYDEYGIKYDADGFAVK